MNIKGKKLCDNCFWNLKNEPCSNCGYKKSQYHPEAGILPVGTVLKQRYHIGMVLGRGGFGVTYKAYDMQMEKIVAIKEYYPNGIAHRDTGTTQMTLADATQKENFSTGAEKFFEEAKTVSRFNGNPNIVSVYEFFYENSTVYYVMEYLEGCDLKHYIKEHGGKISQEQVVTILNVITDALFITHNLNVMHRDISPDNIYISNNGEIKLIDFGAARQVIAEQSKSLSVILKQGFAPLEQYQRKGKQGPWTDIYALGATCLYALTGKVPDDATERIENPEIGDATEYGIDEKLWALLEKCLEIRTVDRYQSVLELKEALKEIDIIPAPIVLAQKEEIPLTVAVSGDYSVHSNSNEIQATVAVGMTENQISSTDVQNKVEKELPILLFLKSRTGIMTIAAVLIVLVVAVAGIVILSSSRGNNQVVNNGGNNNAVNNSTHQPEESEDTTSESVQEDSEEYNTENSGEGNVEDDSQEPETESTPQPPVSETPTPQPPASETPTPQPPASEEPAPQPSESEEPETQEEPEEETWVTDRECVIHMDLTHSSGYYGTKVESYVVNYTGEWKDGMPNGYGRFGAWEESVCTEGFRTYYLVEGEWKDGYLHGCGTVVKLDCAAYKEAPSFSTTDWSSYVCDTGVAKADAPPAYEYGNAGREWIIILTGNSWTDGNPYGTMTKYYAEANDAYPYYLTGTFGPQFNYNYCDWYSWNYKYVFETRNW